MGLTSERSLTQSNALRSAREKNLIFTLGKEEFGIQVLFIKEIIGMQEITVVPNMPAHVKGVMNLRGQVIPVIDLSVKFALAPRDYTDRTCIVVVRSESGGRERLVGAIADGVSEVVTIAAEDIEESPSFGLGAPVSYLLGMAKVRGRVKLLLDMTQVFEGDSLLTLSEPMTTHWGEGQ